MNFRHLLDCDTMQDFRGEARAQWENRALIVLRVAGSNPAE